MKMMSIEMIYAFDWLARGFNVVAKGHETPEKHETGGSLVLWGAQGWGGDCECYLSSISVTAVYSTADSFVAITDESDLMLWGAEPRRDDERAPDKSTNIKTIYSNKHAFAAITESEKVVTWGRTLAGGRITKWLSRKLTGVTKIYSTDTAFAAITKNGVITWGYAGHGGNSSKVTDQLTDVTAIYSTATAFAAISLKNGVVTWGGQSGGGNSDSLKDQLINVTKIYAAGYAFAAITGNGVVTWGEPRYGGDSMKVNAQLTSTVGIYSNKWAFAAIIGNGSVVTWGSSRYGGNSDRVFSKLQSVIAIYSTNRAFAAVTENGNVVTWGLGLEGGDSRKVSHQLTNITKIYSTMSAFAAVGENSGVVTWGDEENGGDTTDVSNQLADLTALNFKAIYSTCCAFAALVVPNPNSTAQPAANPTVQPTTKQTASPMKMSMENIISLIVLLWCFLLCVLFWTLMRGKWEEEERYIDEYTLLQENKRIPSNFTLRHYAMKNLHLGRQLAISTFSQVHIVTIKESKIDVAGKMVNEMAGVTTKAFVQEAKLLQTVSWNCNYIVSFIGIVMNPKIILMEYYKNGSLDKALLEDYNQHGGDDGAEFPILSRLQFISQLCCAVTHLHKHNIVHRDLASRNLLLSDDRKRVALADFGLARRINMIHSNENVTRTVTIPRTSPPESWTKASTGQIPFGLKTDVWSIGMTAIEIVNKRPILNDLTWMKELTGTKSMIPKQLLRDDIKIGRSFARANELWNIMTQCWRKYPEDRLQVPEIHDKIADLIKYPLARQERIYYKAFEDEQAYLASEFSDERSPISWSDKMADFLETSDTASTMSLQYKSLNKQIQVKAYHVAE